jgi:hypothetical protein
VPTVCARTQSLAKPEPSGYSKWLNPREKLQGSSAAADRKSKTIE